MNNVIRKIKAIFLITVTAGVLTACQKESSNSNECKTDMQHISGTYKLTAVKYKSTATATEVDYLSNFEDCEKDDLIELHTNGTYNYNDIGITCSPDQSSNGTWSIKDNTLTMSEDGILDNGIISAFDCKQLVFYHDDIMAKGDRMVFTLTRQ